MTRADLRPLKLPAGLDRSTREWVAALVRPYPPLLQYAHLQELVRELAEVHDLLRRVRSDLRSQGLMVEGRWGPTPNPLLKVEKESSARLRSILAALNLKTAEDARGRRTR